MRSTSIEAYHNAKDSGLVSKLRLQVFKILCDNGELTANEMRGFAHIESNSGVFSTRLSELERMGVIKVVGKRKCSTTGHTALVWGVTGDSPTHYKKQKTTEQKIKELMLMLNDLDSKMSDMFHKHDLSVIISYVKTNFKTK